VKESEFILRHKGQVLLKRIGSPDNGYFLYEDFNLKYYTKEGRKRKHWKNQYQQLSRPYLKDNCKVCGSNNKLSIHHIIPLSIAIVINEKNCKTLCRKCHNILEGLQKEAKVGFYYLTKSIKKRILKIRKHNKLNDCYNEDCEYNSSEHAQRCMAPYCNPERSCDGFIKKDIPELGAGASGGKKC
jgi:hypothetical protein